MSAPPATALIAEDEPLLAASLQRELAELWPELRSAHASDGLLAVRMALEWLPDVLFLDVRMPGCTGLEAAQDIADQWPVGRALPIIVFVTAFDHYAVLAFEQAALDYVVKPVKRERLAACVQRVQQHLLTLLSVKNQPFAVIESTQFATQSIAPTAPSPTPPPTPTPDDQLLSSLRQLVNAAPQQASHAAPARLQRIQASVGNQIVFVAIEDVLCFEAADKYVRVLTRPAAGSAARELLIRTPIKDLLPQLDSDEFWQIHRSTLVRASAIEAVQREESGKLRLRLRGYSELLPVSRIYQSLFHAM
jgi:DNA-binding LytR/AlgR family response regulator